MLKDKLPIGSHIGNLSFNTRNQMLYTKLCKASCGLNEQNVKNMDKRA